MAQHNLPQSGGSDESRLRGLDEGDCLGLPGTISDCRPEDQGAPQTRRPQPADPSDTPGRQKKGPRRARGARRGRTQSVGEGHSVPEDRRLLNRAQAAAYLAISERKLWDLSAARRLATVRIGRSVRYDRLDLDAFIERRKRGAR